MGILLWLNGDGSHPHKVKITTVGLELTDLNLTIGERAKLGITGRLAIEYYYVGHRLNNKGKPTGVSGAVLSSFTTLNGVKWERIGHSFNHYGLRVDIETLSELPKLTKDSLEIKKDGVFDRFGEFRAYFLSGPIISMQVPKECLSPGWKGEENA